MSVNTKVNGQLVKSAGLYKASVPIQSGDIYSFEERQVGVFADGKPLYQKTIDCGTLPNNSTKNVETLTNIEYVVDVEGFVYDNAGYFRPLPFTADSTDIIRVDVQDSVLRIITYTDWSGYAGSYITIKYTKTTDTAGSGEYVPSGDKAVHYDDTEQVIGTWFGETLYRKTVNTGSIPNNTDKSVAHGISNLGIVINVCGNAKNTTYNYYIPLPYSQTDVLYQVAIYCDNTNIHLVTSRDMSGYNESYVTLEYTKTS